MANSLESAPKIFTVNVFQMSKLNTDELRVDYLQNQQKVPIVNEDGAIKTELIEKEAAA